MKDLALKVWEGIRWGYDQTHWFTDKEAWWIYRLGAILETVGWSLLIGAIMYRSFGLPQYETVVTIAGRIHGIFFVCYFAAVVATARSMKWGLGRIIFGLAAGVPPFTALIFEQAMAYDRKKRPVYVAPPANLSED